MTYRIEWVRSSCRMLNEISAEFGRTQPFAGMTIGTGIHLEPKTVALLLTLKAGGADVVSTGNLNSTQPSAVSYLREHGVTVFGGPTGSCGACRAPRRGPGRRAASAPGQRRRPVRPLPRPPVRAPARRDRGDDLGPDAPGRAARRDRQARPRHQRQPDQAVRREPPRGRPERGRVVPADHEPGHERPAGDRLRLRRLRQGVALNFRNNHAIVSVVEIDPVARLEAMFDGFAVPDREEALASAQIIITVTGAQRVITAADLALLADDVVMANAGHFPMEIDVADLLADPSVVGHSGDEGITTLQLADGRKVHLLGEGPWSTWPARGRSATRSSRWTSASPSRRGRLRRLRMARSAGVVRRAAAASDR